MEKGHFLRSKDGRFAVSLIDGGYLLEDGTYVSARDGEKLLFKHTRNVDKTIRETMLQMGKEYDIIVKANMKLKALEKERADLLQAISKIENNAKEIQRGINEQKKNISHLVQDMKSLTVNVSATEQAKMSFYDGTLDIPRAIAIVRANKTRPYKYRYGYAYRGATARPISKEEAIRILMENKSYTDFTADKDCILINQYSDNDMF